MNSLYGFNVIAATIRPKMKLPDDCPVTDDCRREINAWLLEFFGEADPTLLTHAYVYGSNIIMHPRNIAILANHLT
tara:strand:+ start:79 stop:306 length:228 start_codon:yes stop_codon:yes gene_type:complete